MGHVTYWATVNVEILHIRYSGTDPCIYTILDSIPHSITVTLSMGNSKSTPQAEDTILTSTSETESEAIIAFNIGGSTGVILIMVIALVTSFFAYQFCRCCMPSRCRSRGRKNDNIAISNAIESLAVAIGHQNQGHLQQQHHQQQRQKQERQEGPQTGHNYPSASQILASRLVKATGTLKRIPEAKQLQWTQENTEAGPGVKKEEQTQNNPPVIPEMLEQDLQQDPDLIEALWSIIHQA